MCLGIPMQIVEIDGFSAHCAAKGVAREVSLFLTQAEPGWLVCGACGSWHTRLVSGDEMILMSVELVTVEGTNHV